MLENQEKTIKLCKTIDDEISNRVAVSLTETEEKIEEFSEKVFAQIAELKNSVKTDLMEISVVKDMISDVMGSDEILNVVRTTLSCQMCNSMPSPGSYV